MSPTLLSKRLKELELASIIRVVHGPTGTNEYHITEAGEELRPLVIGIGNWGQRWVESRLSLRHLDPALLMWDMRRNLNSGVLPSRRCTIQFRYPELQINQRNYWLITEAGNADVCSFDPGFEVDLIVTTSLKTLTSIWMGLIRLPTEVDAGRIQLEGDPSVRRALYSLLKLSPFASTERRVA